MCCQSVAQEVPFNYILLIIFTLCESYLLAYTTIYYEPLHVLICAGITLAIVIGLTFYANEDLLKEEELIDLVFEANFYWLNNCKII